MWGDLTVGPSVKNNFIIELGREFFFSPDFSIFSSTKKSLIEKFDRPTDDFRLGLVEIPRLNRVWTDYFSKFSKISKIYVQSHVTPKPKLGNQNIGILQVGYPVTEEDGYSRLMRSHTAVGSSNNSASGAQCNIDYCGWIFFVCGSHLFLDVKVAERAWGSCSKFDERRNTWTITGVH